jgi:hypothetical protein
VTRPPSSLSPRHAAAALRSATADPQQIGSGSIRQLSTAAPCALFRFDRIGSAKSSTSAQRFSFGPEPRGHTEPLELPCAERRGIKKSSRALFLSYSARRFSSGPELRGHAVPPELSCAGRRVLKPTGHVPAPKLP